VNAPQGGIDAIIGLLLTLCAHPLSPRYNAWATRLRERHPNFNPAPTARSTKIMTVTLRTLGSVFLPFSILYLLPMVLPKPR
jgi:hypothetical protein